MIHNCSTLIRSGAELTWSHFKTTCDPELVCVHVLDPWGTEYAWLTKLTTAGTPLAWCYVKTNCESFLMCLVLVIVYCARNTWLRKRIISGTTLIWRNVKAASENFLTFVLKLSLKGAKYSWLTILLQRSGDVETNPGPTGSPDGAGPSKVNTTFQT